MIPLCGRGIVSGGLFIPQKTAAWQAVPFGKIRRQVRPFPIRSVIFAVNTAFRILSMLLYLQFLRKSLNIRCNFFGEDLSF